MTENTLVKKLHLKPGKRAAFFIAPPGYIESLGLPENVTAVTSLDAPCDFVQLFVRNSGDLEQYGRRAIDAVTPDGVLWICYPKISSGVKTDLTRDEGWQVIQDAGWRAVAQASVDPTWSAVRFRPEERRTEQAALDAQYAGSKAALRPTYDRVLQTVRGFGNDIDLQVRRSYVAFARGKQFAAVQPATKTRVDLGLKLPGIPHGARLVPATNTGSGSMTHKVCLSSPDEVDDELIGWLRAAYESAQ